MKPVRAADVLDRLQAELRVPSDLALAHRLGLRQSTVASWRQRGRITAGGIARIATAIGRSVEWVRTGAEPSQAPAAVGEPGASHAPGRLLRVLLDPDLTAIVSAWEGLEFEERQTVLRVVGGLQSGSAEVRHHLVGQLKLIDELLQSRRRDRQARAKKGAPPRAKAS